MIDPLSAVIGAVGFFAFGAAVSGWVLTGMFLGHLKEIRAATDALIEREREAYRSDRDTVLDRMQARSLAELEATKLMRTQGPPTTEPVTYDPDWETPSFNNRPKVQQLPEYEDA
jgi:hypothetical protein